ncbi:hypothetical protein HMPREF0322_01890 [Desulfitobacterium hafniense DP7]|uniref:Uncharacterized protein n=1 Tax=Desulfitobacterium hafniense DP7 TaxID=537010 RepID=G9XLQ4_DESHA|nr:hypothetical protein HMPREF0322_01890 [Desulfitobacterium hafniense DP7]
MVLVYACKSKALPPAIKHEFDHYDIMKKSGNNSIIFTMIPYKGNF